MVVRTSLSIQIQSKEDEEQFYNSFDYAHPLSSSGIRVNTDWFFSYLAAVLSLVIEARP
jgi:hypothetical protein